MIRLQSSWLLESATEVASIESLFFPFIHRYSSLNWFSRREMPMTVNNPLDSQAMLLRVWLEGKNGHFSEKNRRKFNQVIKKPLELDMNPFRAWNDRLFDRKQLDYLFYWRESAYEIEEVAQREIFWSAVYAIMSYWHSNRKIGRAPAYEPDEIMHYVLQMHKDNLNKKECDLTLLSAPFEEIEAPEVSLAVFPLIFSDEESEENQLQSIFHAWLHGHADTEQASRDIKNQLRKYSFSLEKKTDFPNYLRLGANADVVAICWSGEELPPRIHEQEIIDPFRREFSNHFSRSRFSIKTINPTTDTYDYLLLFFN
ncbi:MAG: hypothetical protein PWR01_2932 [Clostridiales bacterium]|nr:hypothetical protein [Clostridiales bacterium]MDN5281859.1 hypothetical protein [Candidatus Ozemobacter sp.]